MATFGQCLRMRRTQWRRTRAASSPDGRLPGRSSESVVLKARLRHDLAGGRLEDVDRLEAVAACVGVEQRQLLLAVHGIVRVVDIEDDARRDLRKAAAEQIDQPEPDAGELPPVG
jgi:hypothetical protein